MEEPKREKLPMTEKLELTESEAMALIEGAIKVLIDNSDYFYRSNVGPQYSKITPEGNQMLIKAMTALLPLLADAKHRDLDRRAKEIIMDTLKENHES
jgi:hypothetical protein